eukprot:snap_masked-scaffold_4-processed-gene-12.23-mRNA-1 protein AED:1.00 eAED:1.00 QI:0/-1/0/0/-1/1/1/0/112
MTSTNESKPTNFLSSDGFTVDEIINIRKQLNEMYSKISSKENPSISNVTADSIAQSLVEFVQMAVVKSCRIAKHKGKKKLELGDVQTYMNSMKEQRKRSLEIETNVKRQRTE